MYGSKYRYQRVIRFVLSITMLMTIYAVRAFIASNNYFFKTAQPLNFEKWYPRLHSVIYPLAHSPLFADWLWYSFFVLAILIVLYQLVPLLIKWISANVILFVISLVLALGVAEIVFRYDGAYKSYGEIRGQGHYTSSFKKNDRGWTHTFKPYEIVQLILPEFDTYWRANDEGLRGPDLSMKKNGKRLLVLGDSFTQGVGASSDSCYPQLLQQILKQNADSCYEVINAGIMGADLFSEYMLLSKKMLKYSPDLVVVTTNNTDFYDTYFRNGFDRFQPNDECVGKEAPWFEPLYAQSYLVRRVVHDVFRYDFAFRKPDEINASDSLTFKKMCQVVDSFQTICNVKNIKLVFVFQPFPNEIFNSYNTQVEQLFSYCLQKGIPAFKVADCMAKRLKSDIELNSIYWKYDGHFNSKGYSLLADCVFNVLQSENMLQPCEP